LASTKPTRDNPADNRTKTPALTEQAVVVVAAVHRDDGSGLESQAFGDGHVRDLPAGDARPAGQAAVMVEHEMQLDRALRSAVASPVEDFAAELNGAGVDAAERVLEAEASLLQGRNVTGLVEE
jgi:hypothetical protein